MHFVRADRTNSSDNASAPHVEDEEAEKPVWAFPQEEAPQHIACANESSMCGEVLDLPHPPIGWLQEDEDCAPQAKIWARGGGRH